MEENSLFNEEENNEEEEALLESISFGKESRENEFFTDLFQPEEENLPDQYPSHLLGEDEGNRKEEEKKEDEDSVETTERDLLIATAERRAGTVARQVAKREVIARLHNEDLVSEAILPQIVDSEEFNNSIDERASEILLDQDYVQDEEIPDLVSTRIDEEMKTKLNNKTFIKDGTKIPQSIEEMFGIDKETISDLNNKVETVIDVQSLQLEIRERVILTENVVSVLFGIGLVLFSAGFWQASVGVISVVLRMMFSIPIGILGVGLLIAGGKDLYNKHIKND